MRAPRLTRCSALGVADAACLTVQPELVAHHVRTTEAVRHEFQNVKVDGTNLKYLDTSKLGEAGRRGEQRCRAAGVQVYGGAGNRSDVCIDERYENDTEIADKGGN